MRLPLALLPAAFASACAASAHSGQPVHAFPAREELVRLASQAAPPPLDLDIATVPSWTVTAEAPFAGAAPFAAEGPVDGLLVEIAAATQAEPSASLRCAAEELARVQLETEKGADPGLARFLFARCGAVVGVSAQLFHFAFDLPDDVSLETVLERHRGELLDGFKQALREGEQAGLGLARGQGRAVLMLAHGTPRVDLDGFSRALDAEGRIELRGRLREPAEGLEARINHGAFRVAACERDPAIALPAFRIVCQADPGDEGALLQLSALPPGRVLAASVLDVLALRSPEALRSYAPRELGGARPVGDEQTFRRAALELVNRVRVQAGYGQVQLADAQSSFVASLVPSFFGAYQSHSPEADQTVNQLTLGMMAGWDVRGGTIQSASVVMGYEAMAPDAARWTSDVLDSPVGRSVLLDPDIDALALGALVRAEPGLLAAAAVGYRFHEPEATPGALAHDLLERLAQVRKARGLGETVQISPVVGMDGALSAIERGTLTPSDAMQSVMGDVARASGHAVQGLVWETHDLDAIEFPPALLRRGRLMLGAGVTFYRPPGAAWGQYSVIFVVLDVPDGGDA